MKRVLSVLLALCLLVGLVPMSAGAVADVTTLEGFLQQLVNDGLFYDYDCETVSEKESTGTISYADAVTRVTSLPSCLDLSVYGIRDDAYSGDYKTIPLSQAEWLYKNIFNWSDETWENMLAHAKSNGGYLGNKKYKKAYIKNDTLYGMEGARGNSGTSVTVNATRADGSRMEVVFTGRKQSAQDAPVSYQPYYAMVEKKNIDGKDYWTVYKTRILKDGENPLAKPTVGGFKDVYEGEYYADGVVWAVQNGITSGTGDGSSFSPLKDCTRGEIVTFLWRAQGSPEASTDAAFVDVAPGSYYEKAVKWAVANGVTGGTGNGKFSPDAPCTRAQAVTFMWRAAGEPAYERGGPFTDIDMGEYYADAVQWAVEKGITGGTGNGQFNPGGNCTRGQIVTFLYRGK